MILAHQFFSRILADGAELVIHIGDSSLHVSSGHDGVLVQSKLLIGKFLEHLLCCPFGFPALRDLLLQPPIHHLQARQRQCFRRQGDESPSCNYG